MTEYIIGQKNNKEDILDFINMVFSQAHEPHHFDELLPKLYAEDVDTSSCHYMVKESGKIKGIVGVFPTILNVHNTPLKVGRIGSVAVHEKARGKGYMKKLMDTALQDSVQNGCDAFVLCGLKNRYQHFGFQPSEIVLTYTFLRHNIQSQFKDTDISAFQFLRINNSNHTDLKFMQDLHKKQFVYADRRNTETFFKTVISWNSVVYSISKNKRAVGYIVLNKEHTRISELLLEDIADFPSVLKLLFTEKALSTLQIVTAAHETEKNEICGKYCENYNISTGNSWFIVNYEKVINAFMKLKNTYTALENGNLTLEIEDKPELCNNKTFTLKWGDNLSSTNADYMKLNHLDMEESLFSIMNCFRNYGKEQENHYKNWFPLPLYLPGLDGC